MARLRNTDEIAEAFVTEAVNAGHTPPAPSIPRRAPELVELERRLIDATARQGKLSDF